MVKFIKENQFRIAIIIINAGFLLGLASIFFLANNSFNVVDIIKNPMNWVILIVIYLMFKSSRVLIMQVWKQTYLRDKIEEQTAINLELGNYEKLKELGLEPDFDKLSEDVKKLIK